MKLKHTNLVKTGSAALMASAMLLSSGNAAAETRFSYGVGASYCSNDADTCDNAGVITIGVEQSLSPANSLELAYTGGVALFSSGYHSAALRYKHRFTPEHATSFFVAAGPHYYRMTDSKLFADGDSRTGFGVSTRIGWQRYQPAGFGFDISAFAMSMPGSDITAGVSASLSYAFEL